MRLLALLSALASGLVIWAGLSGQGSSGLAAAVALHNRLLAAAPSAAPATTQPGATAPSIEEAGAEPAPSRAESEGEQATAASSPAAAPASEPEAQSPPSTAPPPATTTPTPSAPAAGPAPAESKIKHVFVITLASPGYDQTWGPGSPAGYLTTQLRPRGTLLGNYYAVGHLDLPNYIAMISGQPPNAQTSADCPTYEQFPRGTKADSQGRVEAPGCAYPLSVLTVADQLTSSRHQWRAYVEDLANGPKPVQSCRHPITDQPDETQHARPSDGYAARHNPFVYFHSLLDLGDCIADDVDLRGLADDLKAQRTTPNLAFIAPAAASDPDAFLQTWVPQIQASKAYSKDGAIAIVFLSGAQGTEPTGALVLSRFVRAGSLYARPYDPLALLRTTEDLFALDPLGKAKGASSFAKAVFTSAFAGD